MATAKKDSPIERLCGATDSVCVYADGPNEAEHLHVSPATWEAMRALTEEREGEADERLEVGA